MSYVVQPRQCVSNYQKIQVNSLTHVVLFSALVLYWVTSTDHDESHRPSESAVARPSGSRRRSHVFPLRKESKPESGPDACQHRKTLSMGSRDATVITNIEAGRGIDNEHMNMDEIAVSVQQKVEVEKADPQVNNSSTNSASWLWGGGTPGLGLDMDGILERGGV